DVVEMSDDWRDQAACARDPDAHPSLFYPAAADEVARARELERRWCGRCPVRQHCIDEAISAGEVGIWGGLTTAQLDRARRRRPNPAAAKPARVLPIWRTCTECARRYDARTSTHHAYCSDDCAADHEARRQTLADDRRSRSTPERACVVCGTTI